MQRDIWLALFLLAVVAGAGLYWWGQQQPVTQDAAPPSAEPAAAGAPAAVKSEPDYRVPPPAPRPGVPLVDLPALSDSDAYFLLALASPFGDGVAGLLRSEDLIERFVATIDNLDRRQLAERIRPTVPVAGNLQTDGDRLSADNYSRYDDYVQRFLAADVDETIALYQRFYPLLQEAWESLGYPGAYFNDRLVAIIDHLLALEDVPTSPRLLRPHVLYEYADDELERQSVGHKTLLRMGPTHTRHVQERLAMYRDRLTRLDDTAGD